MEAYVPLINALAGLAWPLVAAIVVLMLVPTLKLRFRTDDIKFKWKGMDVTLSSSLTEVKDLLGGVTERIAQLEVQGAQSQVSSAAVPPSDEKVLTERKELSAPGRRALWVDDKPEANAVVITQLKDVGLDIDLARSTDEGLRALDEAKYPYDLVLSDIGRTENDKYDRKAGVEFLWQLRASGNNVPVVFFTTERTAQMKFIRDAVANDANAYATGSTTELSILILKAIAKNNPGFVRGASASV